MSASLRSANDRRCATAANAAFGHERKSEQTAAIQKPGCFPTLTQAKSYRRMLVPRRRRAVMSRLAIAFVSALAATTANAQATKSEQSQTPAVADANGTRPFLFDGRMKGDGDRQRALIDDHRSNSGAIVMPPKASKPASEQ